MTNEEISVIQAAKRLKRVWGVRRKAILTEDVHRAVVAENRAKIALCETALDIQEDV